MSEQLYRIVRSVEYVAGEAVPATEYVPFTGPTAEDILAMVRRQQELYEARMLDVNPPCDRDCDAQARAFQQFACDVEARIREADRG